jgi:glycerophosphoryl diester phosphodiesterase
MRAVTLPASIEYGGASALLKYHKFDAGLGDHAPNSLGALEQVLAAGVGVIEFDISLLGDGSFALLHDQRLERETDGEGPLATIGVGELKSLRLRGSSEPPATLDEVVERLRRHERPVKVQVDLKEVEPLPDPAAALLIDSLARLRENGEVRVVVGCMADWNLRLLRRLDPSLEVGNDPVFYLHAPAPGLRVPFPTRVNAYGYVDDHPLGYRKALPIDAYLRDRLDAIAAQVPGTSEFYLHKVFVSQALADGFDPIDHMRREWGLFVDVWTINAGQPGAEQELRQALAAGADQITTDTPVGLSELTSLPAR